LSYLPFPVDELIIGLAAFLRANRNVFDPPAGLVELDEFWGLGQDIEALPDVFAIVQSADGELGLRSQRSSEDTVRADIFLFCRTQNPSPRASSLTKLRQLVQLLRSPPTIISMAGVTTPGTEILSLRPVSIEPDQQFAEDNFWGWRVRVEIRFSCKADKNPLPTFA